MRTYELAPNDGNLFHWIWSKMSYNDFSTYERDMQLMLDESIQGNYKPNFEPFHALHFPNLTLQDIYHVSHQRGLLSKDTLNWQNTFEYREHHNKIKIGFVSYDMRGHAVGIVMQNVFEFFDDSKFSLFVYSTYPTPSDQDKVRNRIKERVSFFKHVPNSNQLEEQVLSDQIDILIDIGLYTTGSSISSFCKRLAPIQIAGIGLAVTTGLDAYDYLIVDSVVVNYNETAAYSVMPNAYHPFSHRYYYDIPKAVPRENLALPDDVVLLCNHASAYRLHPEALNIWISLLKKHPNTALVLKRFSGARINFIVEALEKEGIPAEQINPDRRLFFMQGAAATKHLSEKAVCDIYLDLHWYNGHSTTGDMLWAGVPMITFPAQSMASRAAASFAYAAGFPEMVVNSWEEYDSRATEWITNPTKLKNIRARLEDSRMYNALFDTERWTRDFSTGLEIVYEKFKEGYKPSNVVIPYSTE